MTHKFSKIHYHAINSEFSAGGGRQGPDLKYVKCPGGYLLSVFLQSKLAEYPLVIRYFRALSRSHPVFVKGDISLVLQPCTSSPFEPLSELLLKMLMLKTALIVALQL